MVKGLNGTKIPTVHESATEEDKEWRQNTENTPRAGSNIFNTFPKVGYESLVNPKLFGPKLQLRLKDPPSEERPSRHAAVRQGPQTRWIRGEKPKATT